MGAAYADVETEPWDDVMARHDALLCEQIEYLAAESPYYRRRFREWDVDPGDVTGHADLPSIPFTTKDDERRSQAAGGTDDPLGDHQAVDASELSLTLSSSGTTGTPTYFGYTPRDREATVEMVCRGAHAMGVRPGDTVVHAIGRPMVPGGLPYIEAYGELGANVVPAGGTSSAGLVGIIGDLEPAFVHSTPSHLRYLIDRTPEVADRPVADLGVGSLIGGGEPGIANPEIRERLRDAWAVDGVREVIGLGDASPAVAAECPAEDGAHFIGQEQLHVELVDPATGDQLEMAAGAEGELVYTPLGREATPLLRFRSGDHARIVGTDCECGRTAPRLQVVGRTDDMLIYKGRNVYPAAIRRVVATVDGASPRVSVVLPAPETYQFESPIPIRVVRPAETDRSAAAIADDVAERVREELRVRVDPTVVAPTEATLSKYKTDLVVVE